MSRRKGRCECGCGERTRVAPYTSRERGWVIGRPIRFVSGHNSRYQWQTHYDECDNGYATACWMWRGAPNGSNDYGRVCVSGKSRPAHRAFYELHVGPVPSGLFLDHLCRCTMCVNPAHLEPVTIAENTRRGALARITADDARDIRQFYVDFMRRNPLNAKGKPRQRLPQGVVRDLAAKYGLAPITIIGIAKGRSWAE